MALTLGLSIALLAAGALQHHDLACHLRSTTHCTTCLFASLPGSEARTDAIPVGLALVGRVSPESDVPSNAAAVSTQTDRSPPAC